MNYTYLNVFYTVAKLQNISKAAKELDVTQPAVSRIISNIEKEYNTKLFFRSKTGVTLTRDGLNLFEMIKNPLIELEKISSNLADNKNLDNVVIHIGATATGLYCYVFKYLEKFKQMYPNVTFRIYSNSSAKLLDMVDKGSIDLALITTPFEGGEDLDIIKIARLNDILVAPISYKEKLKDIVSIKDLVNYPFVLLSKEMQFREFLDAFFASNGVHIGAAYETDSSAILLPFVELNCGLTFIPDEMAHKSIEEGKCYKVNLKEDLPERYIVFAIKKDKNRSGVLYDIKQKIISSSIKNQIAN